MSYYKIVTYGCQMNVHESEILAGILERMGFQPTKKDEEADIAVFNTCCIRDNAERRAVGNIGAFKKIKKERPSVIVCVLGCMTEQKEAADKLYKMYPFVDIILGTHNKYELGEAIASVMADKKRWNAPSGLNMAPQFDEAGTVSRTSGTNAWVNISYGCNNFCTYCIVPYVRGRERSRAPEEIEAEVKGCLDAGYKEITLLGQNVDSYGRDLNGIAFADLLERLAGLPYKFRLGYMTSHPKDFNERVIEVVKSCPNVAKYIHLPIQSGSDRVLKAMNRRYTREKYLSIIDKIRETIPEAGITTDVMVGFPGETEEDFEETLELVRQVKYSNAFMFVYSPRKGTPAASMEQLSEEVKTSRIVKLVELQRSITEELSNSMIGSIRETLAEDISPKYKDMLCGRTDNGRLVHFSALGAKIGDFIKVKIIKNKASALIGEAEGGKG